MEEEVVGFLNELFFLIENAPVTPHSAYLQNLEKYKDRVDKTPDVWLQFQLDDAIKHERFELAAYIRDTMKTRTVPIFPT